MSTYVDIAMKSTFVAFLFPLAIYSIANGSVAPKGSWFEKYYGVEKNIGIVGNVFLIVLGVMCFADLAQHFGLIDKHTQDTFAHIMAVPFLVLCFAYLRLWIRAWRKIRPSKNKEV